MKRAALLFLAVHAIAGPLVVVSVDGLDRRYLADDKLKIPNLRRLMRDGQASRGVIGVVPTITWPSHTTLITGVDPITHGILGNQGYLNYSQIKTRTLIGAAHEKGVTVATITWPVTVDAPVEWNLPEYFQKRRGGAMDLHSIESKSKPADLIAKISAAYPSFAQEWMDDRTRTIAAVWLLKNVRPGLMLLHLVDLDSEEHDDGPFSREANAILERTDELIGEIRAAMPAGYSMAIVSDHGFERVETMVNLGRIVDGAEARGGVVIARDEETAHKLRDLDKKYGVGREIPKEELQRFPSQLPAGAAAVFESVAGFMFWPAAGGETFSKPAEIGNHGHWPTRYRAVYVLTGPDIQHDELPEFSMKEIAARLAGVLGVAW